MAPRRKNPEKTRLAATKLLSNEGDTFNDVELMEELNTCISNVMVEKLTDKTVDLMTSTSTMTTTEITCSTAGSSTYLLRRRSKSVVTNGFQPEQQQPSQQLVELKIPTSETMVLNSEPKIQGKVFGSMEPEEEEDDGNEPSTTSLTVTTRSMRLCGLEDESRSSSTSPISQPKQEDEITAPKTADPIVDTKNNKLLPIKADECSSSSASVTTATLMPRKRGRPKKNEHNNKTDQNTSANDSTVQTSASEENLTEAISFLSVEIPKKSATSSKTATGQKPITAKTKVLTKPQSPKKATIKSTARKIALKAPLSNKKLEVVNSYIKRCKKAAVTTKIIKKLKPKSNTKTKNIASKKAKVTATKPTLRSTKNKASTNSKNDNSVASLQKGNNLVSSETLEDDSNNSNEIDNTKKELTENGSKEPMAETIIPSPPPVFEHLEENFILCDDALSRESKAIRCNCTPSDDDLLKGRGCGEDCINRLLFMECGSRCPSSRYCTNKRFQKRLYSDVEMFPAGAKGWGLKAKSQILKGQFIIEYVGEVVDVFEMAKRMKRYGKDPNHKHHYFMALRNGAVIDATSRGNLSRFINHSCDPNAITQKWTVNRQLRIGFFALKTINAGDEIVFNYQFERYGKKAQECFCGSANCTGYIGVNNGNDEEDDEESDISFSEASSSDDDEEDASIVQKEILAIPATAVDKPTLMKSDLVTDFKPKSTFLSTEKLNSITMVKKKVHRDHRNSSDHHHHHHKRFESENDRKKALELAEVSEILNRGPLRNKDQVLEFNRLMVRVDNVENRQKMVEYLLNIEDPVILRLFVENQGLGLIRIWFVMPDIDELKTLKMRNNIVKLLCRLPLTSKNQVDEASILPTLKHLQQFELSDETVMEEVVADLVYKVCAEADEGVMKERPNTITAEYDNFKNNLQRLLDKWSTLSYFKIPKKVSSILAQSNLCNSNAESNNGINNDSYASKFDRNYSDMVIDSDDETDSPRPWNAGGRFQNYKYRHYDRDAERYLQNYKGYTHLGVTKIMPDALGSCVITTNVPPNISISNQIYPPPQFGGPPPSYFKIPPPPPSMPPPVVYTMPPPPIALSPAMTTPFPGSLVMYPPPHMMIHPAHAAAAAAAVAAVQASATPGLAMLTPPPPPTSNAEKAEVSTNGNVKDKATDDGKTSEDWFKTMAEEAASVALKANAQLNNGKTTVNEKKNEKANCGSKDENQKTADVSRKKKEKYRRHSRSRSCSSRSSSNDKRSHSRSRSFSRSRSPRRRHNHRHSRSRSRSRGHDMRRKSFGYRRSTFGYRRSLFKGSFYHSRDDRNRRYSSHNDKYDERRKSKKSDRDRDRNRSKEQPEREFEKVKEKNNDIEKPLKLDSIADNKAITEKPLNDDNINSEPQPEMNESYKWRESIDAKREAFHLAHFHMPLSPLRISPIEQNKFPTTPVHEMESKENSSASNSEVEDSDCASVSSVEQLKKSVRNSLKRNKAMALNKSKCQLTININGSSMTTPAQQSGSPDSNSSFISNKIHFSPILLTKMMSASPDDNNDKFLMLPPPPLPPSDLLLKEYDLSDELGSNSTIFQNAHFNVNAINNCSITTLTNKKGLVKPNVDVVRPTGNASNTLETSPAMQKYGSDINGPPLPPMLLPKTLSSLECVDNYINSLNNYVVSIHQYMDFLTDYCITSFGEKPRNLPKRDKTEHNLKDDKKCSGEETNVTVNVNSIKRKARSILSDQVINGINNDVNNRPRDPRVLSKALALQEQQQKQINPNEDTEGPQLKRRRLGETTTPPDDPISNCHELLSSSNHGNSDSVIPSTSNHSDTTFQQYQQMASNQNEESQTKLCDVCPNSSNDNNNNKNDEDMASSDTTTTQDRGENSDLVYVEKVVSKSGNWLSTRDADGNVYYFHQITREAVWELPLDERIEESKVNPVIERNEKRAEFKRQVSEFVSWRMEPYRKRFFFDSNDFIQFLRKITHKVIDNQDKCNNPELKFTELVRNNTKRLVDEYIRLFKASNSNSSGTANLSIAQKTPTFNQNIVNKTKISSCTVIPLSSTSITTAATTTDSSMNDNS